MFLSAPVSKGARLHMLVLLAGTSFQRTERSHNLMELEGWLLGKKDGIIHRAPIPHVENVRGVRLAVCIAGTARAVGMALMHESFVKYISGPIKQEGGQADPFFVLSNGTLDSMLTSLLQWHSDPNAAQVGSKSEGSCLTAEDVLEVWKGADVFMREDDFDKFQALKSACIDESFGTRWLKQFLKVQICFERINRREIELSETYEWILRMRSDHVIFSSLPPLYALPKMFVYVPRAVMSPQPRHLFVNDHAFLCPRARCAPYFSTSSSCDVLREVDENRLRSAQLGYHPQLWTRNYGLVAHYPNQTACIAACQLNGGMGVPDDVYDSGIIRAISWSFTVARPNHLECDRILYNEDSTRARGAFENCRVIDASARAAPCAHARIPPSLYGPDSCLCQDKLHELNATS